MHSRLKLFLFLIVTTNVYSQHVPKFDVQGHRGARGLKPENSIPGFIAALNYGVTTVEMDLVITKNKKVIVSHDPWISSEICLDSAGKAIAKEQERAKQYNIYQLTYSEVQAFDCGSKPHPRFPEQEKLKTVKPLLRDVIIAIENHIKSYSLYEVDYNIEIKSLPENDNKFHPTPEEFSDLVFQLIDEYLPWERVVIQSFDFRVLKYWNAKYPQVRLAALVEKLPNPKAAREKLNTLGFTPSIYSPDLPLLDQETVKIMHQKKIRVIPWTINEPEDMKRVKAWGVDGLITDYPNRAAELGYTIKYNQNLNSRDTNRK
jgi:glycerophosphoryl diester phosphodiesterase